VEYLVHHKYHQLYYSEGSNKFGALHWSVKIIVAIVAGEHTCIFKKGRLASGSPNLSVS